VPIPKVPANGGFFCVGVRLWIVAGGQNNGTSAVIRGLGALVRLLRALQAVGNGARMEVVKNKVAPPFRVAEFDIDYGRGISKVGSVLDVAVQAGPVKRGGAYFAYGSERLGQGRAKAKAFLEGRPELVEANVEEVIAGTAGDVPEAPPSMAIAA
jgi:hypothetical protein